METCLMQDLSWNFRALLMNLAVGLGMWISFWRGIIDRCAEHLSWQLFRISSFPFHLHWHRVCHDIVVFFRDSVSSWFFNLALPLIDPAYANIWTMQKEDNKYNLKWRCNHNSGTRSRMNLKLIRLLDCFTDSHASIAWATPLQAHWPWQSWVT